MIKSKPSAREGTYPLTVYANSLGYSEFLLVIEAWLMGEMFFKQKNSFGHLNAD